MKRLFILPIFILNINLHCQELSNMQIEGITSKAILFDKLTRPAAILVRYDKFYDEQSISPCGTYNSNKFGNNRELYVEGPTMYILPIGIQVPYLIFEYDTLIFTDKGKNIPTKTGNPSLKHNRLFQRTNELEFFEDLYDTLGACYGIHSYSIPGQIQTFQEMILFQQRKLENRLSFLQRRINKKVISSVFSDYVEKYFANKFYDDVFNGLLEKRYFDPFFEKEIIETADSLIKRLNQNKAENYAWYKALMSYVSLKSNSKQINNSNLNTKIENISKALTSKARDFAVFYFYKKMLNNQEKIIDEKDLQIMEKYCSDRDYLDYISGNTKFTSIQIKEKKKNDLTDIILNVDKTNTKLSFIIDSLKGNVIYIDFWASWCIPCLEEIPFSKKLMEHYKNDKVVFIFLSIDKFSLPWISSIKKQNLQDKGLHFLIIQSESNFFINKYNVGPIPRYILINKKGEVVNPDAPRPSEEKTKKLILELLNQ